MKDFKYMTNEKLKEEFIEWFGKEKWEEEEILEFLQCIIFDVCLNWLKVEPIPVVFETVPGNVAVFDNKFVCIKVSNKYKDDKVSMVAAIVHELEHYYQLLYVANFDTPKAKRWKKELNNYISGDKDLISNVLQEVEIDAEAFAEIVLSCEYGIEYRNPIPELQEAIEIYIKSRKILEE